METKIVGGKYLLNPMKTHEHFLGKKKNLKHHKTYLNHQGIDAHVSHVSLHLTQSAFLQARKERTERNCGSNASVT